MSKDFQARVYPWLVECFGEEIANDLTERNHRFLEESLELVQATGCTQDEARQLVDYVYGRPVGEQSQECGGVMVTLAALSLAAGIDMHQCGETELSRVWTKVEQIRAKQAAKPKHSPLPAAPKSNPSDAAISDEAEKAAVLCGEALSRAMRVAMKQGDAKYDVAPIIQSAIDNATASLLAQVRQLTEERDTEKERRIYYQSIVYDVCNKIDNANNLRPGNGIVCGTKDTPSRGAQEALARLIAQRDAAMAQVEALRRDGERLDWLGRNPSKVRYIAPYWYSGYEDAGSLNPDGWSSTGQWRTPRAAIDAAQSKP